MTKRHLYIILIGLLYTFAAAAVPYCDVRKFSITDGLAANTISDIKQGHDRLMWFGTWNGLSFYDGYSFQTFRDEPDKTDILSTNRLLKIEPTFKNNIWCVTYDRQLYVYDTHACKFTPFGKELDEKFGIDLRTDQIYPMKNGHTWVTDANGKYLLRTDGPTIGEGTPTLIRPGEQGIRSGKVWFIRDDFKGREWILTDKGTTIYGTKFSTPIPFKWIRWVGSDIYLATEDGRLATYDAQGRFSMIPMPQGVTRINQLKHTGYQLLIATNLGVVIYNPRTFKFDIINVQSPSQPLAEVTNMYTDYYGMVWAFTKGMGVTRINPRNNEKLWLFADQPDPADRTSSSKYFITQDENHTLWVVPNGGTFSYYDRHAKRLVPYLLRSNSSGNFRIPNIDKFLLSDQGILWITGVHDLTQVAFKYHFYTLNQLDEGESEVKVIATLPGKQTWTGYYNGIIQVTDPHQQKLGYLSPGGTLVPTQMPFSYAGIHALYFDTKGRAWIGTNGDGLYLIQGAKVTHYAPDPHNPSSLPHGKIYDITADRNGRIWIATYGGGPAIVRENPDGTVSFASRRNGLPWPKTDYARLRTICCTTSGTILIGTTDGLVTLSDNFGDPRNIKTFTSSYRDNDTTTVEASDVNSILEHTNGKVYISELGGTLEEIASKQMLQNDLKVKISHVISSSEGIVQGMVEDNQGQIWIIRESSIDRVNLKTGKTEVFGPNDFDYNMSFTEARPYHDPATDNISVGTPMGLLTFNPATMKKSVYQPHVVFTTLHYNGESTTEPILHREKVVVPANKRNLTISFATLDYMRKYRVSYAYRIEGHTPAGVWISNGSRNSISFNYISHGDYVLKVRATNSHGVWSKHVAELPLEVRPTFWESVWGRMLLLLIVMVIIGTIFYSYNQRQQQGMKHEMSVMKNEFFSKAAHQLRTPLTLIGGPVREVLGNEHGLTRKGREMLQIVENNSREMLEMLDKMLVYDNSVNFYTNSGLEEEDIDKTEDKRKAGQIDDTNAATYLDELQQEQKAIHDHLVETGNEADEQKGANLAGAPTILVVEDNTDLRKYLYNILSARYNVLLAENGKAGLMMARTHTPDLILTDVTMPVMDGITMVHQLKEDRELETIPIIILSAKASVEDQLKGFEEGIDAYLTKPFSSTYLLGRIASVISQRQKIKGNVIRKLRDAGDSDAIRAMSFIPNMGMKPQQTNTPAGAGEKEADGKQQGNANAQQEMAFMSIQVNDRTMERIIKFVNENVGNPDLKIDDIAAAVGMSRSVLYNKIKTAVGMTPIDFVRHIRIMKATEMLQNTDDSLTVIAFNLGFSDPKYFSKVFKKETGIIPSEYRERTRKL